QMAWNLQPFLGDRGEPFRLFRHNEGNFYTAIVYSLQKLAHGEGRPGAAKPKPPETGMDVRRLIDSGAPAARDSAGATGR
ncbi:MAG: hypothetical protein ABIP29_12060, partial [Candidatus Eisenbacteria bacterium]